MDINLIKTSPASAYKIISITQQQPPIIWFWKRKTKKDFIVTQIWILNVLTPLCCNSITNRFRRQRRKITIDTINLQWTSYFNCNWRKKFQINISEGEAMMIEKYKLLKVRKWGDPPLSQFQIRISNFIWKGYS